LVFDTDRQTAPRSKPVDHAHGFGDHLDPYAVTRQDHDFFVGW
jgi:hypothetical protein